MKAHALARYLLNGPDRDVVFLDEGYTIEAADLDYSNPEHVEIVPAQEKVYGCQTKDEYEARERLRVPTRPIDEIVQTVRASWWDKHFEENMKSDNPILSLKPY